LSTTIETVKIIDIDCKISF